MEEACASSRVRFRAPESPRGSFVGVGSELACSSLRLRLGHSPSLPVEEACASSGVRFRVPESLKGSFVRVGSELARGRSSVEEVKSGREELLRGRNQALVLQLSPGRAGGGLGGPRTWCPQRQVGSLGFAQGRWCLHLSVLNSENLAGAGSISLSFLCLFCGCRRGCL